MAYELVYTSSPEGVNRGSSGFCVVACTRGLGPRLVAALEGYSAYKPLFPHYDAENAWNNPISRTHYIFEANGDRQHILSRICFNGVDYTGRSNKLASHLVLSSREAEKAAGGPASLLLQDGLFKDAKWPIRVELYDTQLTIPEDPAHPAKCCTWEAATGDAGWGGYLAKSFLDNPQRNVYIIYDLQQQDLIPRLFDEAINLLPEDRRWDVTFNSYFVTLPAGASCTWRGVVRDSDASRLARRFPENIIIDLAHPGTLSEDDDVITAARTGVFPAAPPPTDTIPQTPIQLPDFQEETSEDRIRTTPPPARPSAAAPRKTRVVKRIPEEFPVRRKMSWIYILLPFLAVIIVFSVLFIVNRARENRRYDEALRQCTELRGTIDSVEKSRMAIDERSRGEKREKELKSLVDETRQLLQTLEAVREKMSELEKHQGLFDDALRSGKLADKQNTPHELREVCEQLSEALQHTMKRLERNLKDARRSGAAGRKPDAPPAPEKRPPAPEKPRAEKPPLPPKRTAAPDLPDFLWRTAEKSGLYERNNAGKRRTVNINLGDVQPKDIEIMLLPDDKMIYCPGKEIRCKNDDDNDVILKTAFDESTGTLAISVEKYCLPPGRLILVRTNSNGKRYPLFFDPRVSKPIVKTGEYPVRIKGADGIYKLKIDAEIPPKVYHKSKHNSKLLPAKLKLELRLNDGTVVPCDEHGIAMDKKLEAIIREIKAIAGLKSKIASGAAIDDKVDWAQLPEELRERWKKVAAEKNDKERKKLVRDFVKDLDALIRKSTDAGKNRVAELKKIYDGSMLVISYVGDNGKPFFKSEIPAPAPGAAPKPVPNPAPKPAPNSQRPKRKRV